MIYAHLNIEPRLRYILEFAEIGLRAAIRNAELAKIRGNLQEQYIKVGEATVFADLKMQVVDALVMHLSDCSLHDAPASDCGPCDCGAL